MSEDEQPPPARLNIRGVMYLVTETPCKRRQDVRRWEIVREDFGSRVPLIVTFQAYDGSKSACSCWEGIHHRWCDHQEAFRAWGPALHH